MSYSHGAREIKEKYFSWIDVAGAQSAIWLEHLADTHLGVPGSHLLMTGQFYVLQDGPLVTTPTNGL